MTFQLTGITSPAVAETGAVTLVSSRSTPLATALTVKLVAICVSVKLGARPLKTANVPLALAKERIWNVCPLAARKPLMRSKSSVPARVAAWLTMSWPIWLLAVPPTCAVSVPVEVWIKLPLTSSGPPRVRLPLLASPPTVEKAARREC